MASTSIRDIDEHTRLVGLLGQSDGNWSSPKIFNAAFDALELNWRCVPLPVAEGRLREALRGLRALGFAGAEVGGPYQRNATKNLDRLSPAAETIGVVNFVRVEDGSLVGDNTRWASLLGELHTLVSSVNELRPLVIGAGDAARSVVYALAREGLPITIVSPQIERAIDLVRRLRHVLDEHSFSVYRWPHDLAEVVPGVNLIVNTNAVEKGSSDRVAAGNGNAHGPWPDDLAIPRDTMVFDLTCGPEKSQILSRARESGACTIDGLSLRVYEAALAFERWTGHAPPLEVMFRTARGLSRTRRDRPARFPNLT